MGLAVLVSACVAIELTRVPGGIALVWPSDAIAAALLIRFRHLRCGRAALAVIAAFILANLLIGHRPWTMAVLFGSVNLTEIALMVAAFRFARVAPYPNITIGHAALMTAVFGIAIPGAMAVVGGFLLHALLGLPRGQGTLQWWSSHAIGACLAGPPIILFSIKSTKRLMSGRFGVQNAMTALLSLIACYLTIRYVRFPFVTMALLLLVTAFQMGGFGASIMSVAFGLLITNLWILGIRPLGLDPAAATSGSLIGLPVIALLATVMPPIAVGLEQRCAARRHPRAQDERAALFANRWNIPRSACCSRIWTVSGDIRTALFNRCSVTAPRSSVRAPAGPARPRDRVTGRMSRERWGGLLRGESGILRCRAVLFVTRTGIGCGRTLPCPCRAMRTVSRSI